MLGNFAFRLWASFPRIACHSRQVNLDSLRFVQKIIERLAHFGIFSDSGRVKSSFRSWCVADLLNSEVIKRLLKVFHVLYLFLHDASKDSGSLTVLVRTVRVVQTESLLLLRKVSWCDTTTRRQCLTCSIWCIVVARMILPEVKTVYFWLFVASSVRLITYLRVWRL